MGWGGGPVRQGEPQCADRKQLKPNRTRKSLVSRSSADTEGHTRKQAPETVIRQEIRICLD